MNHEVRNLALPLLPQAAIERRWMLEAMKQARVSQLAGEVPVGAVVVNPQGVRVASGSNRVFSLFDPTAHAEMVALRKAMKRMKATRGPGLRIYVTLQPCWMCLAALLHASVSELYFLLPAKKIWPTLKKGGYEALSTFYDGEPPTEKRRYGSLQTQRLDWAWGESETHSRLRDHFKAQRFRKFALAFPRNNPLLNLLSAQG